VSFGLYSGKNSFLFIFHILNTAYISDRREMELESVLLTKAVFIQPVMTNSAVTKTKVLILSVE
jgi:hypothetical protein